MKNIIVFILFICLVLSLFSYCFMDGESLSFEEAYKGLLKYVTDIGGVLSDLKDGIVSTFTALVQIPNNIGNFFANFEQNVTDFANNTGSSIADFLQGIADAIAEGFNKIFNDLEDSMSGGE